MLTTCKSFWDLSECPLPPGWDEDGFTLVVVCLLCCCCLQVKCEPFPVLPTVCKRTEKIVKVSY